MAGFYNGYSWQQRAAILKARKQLEKAGDLAPLAYLNSGGPCGMCNEPGPHTQWHSEDYSSPFLLAPPATFIVCATCHGRLHKRFAISAGTTSDWPLFVLFLNRGGYGREFVQAFTSKQRTQLLTRILASEPLDLPRVRPRDLDGHEWWQHLTLDPESLEAAWARPRPLRPRPPQEAYRAALAAISLREHELGLLRAHAAAPRRSLSMRAAALAVYGRPQPSMANLGYGTLARRMAQALDWQSDQRDDGSPIWMSVIAEGWQPAGREFEWVMLPQLARSIEGWSIVW